MRRRVMPVETGQVLRRELRGGGDGAPDLTDPILALVHRRRPFLDLAEQARVRRLQRLVGGALSMMIVGAAVAYFSPDLLGRLRTEAMLVAASSTSSTGSVGAAAERSAPPASLARVSDPDPGEDALPSSAANAPVIARAVAERAWDVTRAMISPSPGEPPRLGRGTVVDQVESALRDADAAQWGEPR